MMRQFQSWAGGLWPRASSCASQTLVRELTLGQLAKTAQENLETVQTRATKAKHDKSNWNCVTEAVYIRLLLSIMWNVTTQSTGNSCSGPWQETGEKKWEQVWNEEFTLDMGQSRDGQRRIHAYPRLKRSPSPLQSAAPVPPLTHISRGAFWSC